MFFRNTVLTLLNFISKPQRAQSLIEIRDKRAHIHKHQGFRVSAFGFPR